MPQTGTNGALAGGQTPNYRLAIRCFFFSVMPSFAYVASETATGREIRNSVEAANEQAAIAALLNRNLLVVSIQEKFQKGQNARRQSAPGRFGGLHPPVGHHGRRGHRHRASAPGPGRPDPNKLMRDVIRDVCTRVESGDSFSEALQKHPKTFNRLYVSMVAAGEKGGLLAEILARLASIWKTPTGSAKK